MKNIAIILADGFEEVEAITMIDLLKRVGIRVEILALENLKVTGAHDITIEADEIYNYYGALEYDGVLFAGGMGNARALSENSAVIDLINNYYENGKMIAAICASPALIFPKTKISKDTRCTCYPETSLTAMLEGYTFVDERVVVCDNVLTSQSPFTALEFALNIVEYLGYDGDNLLRDLQGK